MSYVRYSTNSKPCHEADLWQRGEWGTKLINFNLFAAGWKKPPNWQKKHKITAKKKRWLNFN